MRNCSWADLTEDEFGEQWIHGTSAEPKTRKNICAGVADGVKHKVKEHNDWLAIWTDPSSSIGSMQSSAPTLLEALDLVRANNRDSPEQICCPNEVKFTNVKKNQENETVDSTTLLSHWLEVEVRKLPLNVIVLHGRGRNRTGPLAQWPPKRVRHCPCPTKKTEQSVNGSWPNRVTYVCSSNCAQKVSKEFAHP